MESNWIDLKYNPPWVFPRPQPIKRHLTTAGFGQARMGCFSSLWISSQTVDQQFLMATSWHNFRNTAKNTLKTLFINYLEGQSNNKLTTQPI